MDKNAIKKYAVWARNELIERVSQKADQYEISADADPNADSAHGVLLTADEKKQRAALIGQVKEKGFDQVMEEVAYTWFNRFSALRFMEVNNYLPSTTFLPVCVYSRTRTAALSRRYLPRRSIWNLTGLIWRKSML